MIPESMWMYRAYIPESDTLTIRVQFKRKWSEAASGETTKTWHTTAVSIFRNSSSEVLPDEEAVRNEHSTNTLDCRERL